MPEAIEPKRCSKCKQEYPPTTKYFYKGKKNKDGLRTRCKQCHKQYREVHREQRLHCQRQYNQSRRDQQKCYFKQYYENHKVELKNYQKQHKKTIEGHLRHIWYAMLSRCRNPKNKGYKYYGGRGIKVIFACFEDFYNHVINELKIDPRSLTIDRINNDENYERNNIRFVTMAKNCQNRRRNN